MRFSKILTLIMLIIISAAGCTPDTAPIPGTSSSDEARSPVSVAAKLYWVAKLMDNHDNWPQVSQLLNEILEAKLESDYVNTRVEKVKQYVDGEKGRRMVGAVAGSRLDTHTFLEARLLIVECIQELRPRLNISWTGEVRHLKKMLFTALFPHGEEDGEIEFPAASTYSFDTYAYTMKNLKALMIAPGGKDLSPLFSKFLTDKNKKTDKDEDVGSNMYFKRLSNIKDKIHADLLAEHIDPDKITKVTDTTWDPDKDTTWDQNGGWDPGGDDDWDWRGHSDAEERILSLKRIYKYVTKLLAALRTHRSIDDYEPLTLLMIAVANPGLIEHDPQLKAFVSGVKFKYRVTDKGSDGEGFKPIDHRLVAMVNDALVPSNNIKLQYETDRKGHLALYVISNLNGQTNLAANILSFQNAVMAIQTVRWLPDTVVAFGRATPENLTKMAEYLNKLIERLSRSDNMIYRIVGSPTKVAFDITIALGSKTLAAGATATTNFLKKYLETELASKTIKIIKSEELFKSLVAASVACDLTQGTIEYYYSNNKEVETPKIIIRTTSKISDSLVYLIKSRPAILGAAALDIGHMLYSKIPSIADIVEFSLTYGYNIEEKVRTGTTPREKELNKLKAGLGIKSQEEALGILTNYQNAIHDAAPQPTDDDLAKVRKIRILDEAKNNLSKALSMYAARRLVFHYVTITALNGKGSRELGYELRNQSEEYDRVYWSWFNPPGSKLKEQMGLAVLDREFEKTYLALGGKLPEKAKPEAPKKTDPKKPNEPKDPKKDDPDKDLPWDDVQ